MNAATSRPIRIVFLGADEFSPELARAVLETPDFVLTAVCDLESSVDERARALLEGLGRRRLDNWEALLDSQTIDAVIVARGSDEDQRADQLRKLAQAGVPVLASQPVVNSALVYYELDMIRRETAGILVPHLIERHHPAILRLAALVSEVADSPLGRVEQIAWERSLESPSRASILAHFSRDVDLLRSIAGEMQRLGAMAASGELTSASLGVQMSGPGGIAGRWSIVPGQSANGAQLTVIASSGRAVCRMPAGGQPWTIDWTLGGQSEVETFAAWDPAAQSLEQLKLAMSQAAIKPDWIDAAHCLELAETIERSLHKGRTIELHYENYTEEGTFKGVMASLGCGLLLFGMFFLGAVAIAEQMGVPFLRHWPKLLLGGFALFLVLQFLIFVSRREQSPAGDELSASSGR